MSYRARRSYGWFRSGRSRVVSLAVVRVFLVVWLAAFTVQSSDLLAAVVPDACATEAEGAAGDPCPDRCARCVCCAAIAVGVLHVAAATSADLLEAPISVAPSAQSLSGSPHGVLHVPKIR